MILSEKLIKRNEFGSKLFFRQSFRIWKSLFFSFHLSPSVSPFVKFVQFRNLWLSKQKNSPALKDHSDENKWKSFGKNRTRTQPCESFTSLYLQTCKYLSYKVTCEVKFNPLIVVGQSTLYLKLKTSVSGLNLTIPVTASDFKSVHKSF